MKSRGPENLGGQAQVTQQARTPVPEEPQGWGSGGLQAQVGSEEARAAPSSPAPQLSLGAPRKPLTAPPGPRPWPGLTLGQNDALTGEAATAAPAPQGRP